MGLEFFYEHTYKLSQNFEQQQEGNPQSPQKLSPKEDDLELKNTGVKTDNNFNDNDQLNNLFTKTFQCCLSFGVRDDQRRSVVR